MTYPNVYASQTGPLALSSLDANFLYAVDIANAALTATAGGTADAITATYSPAPAALVAGLTLYVRAASANATTTPQFSPNGLTGKVITKNNNQALAVGDIAGAGHWLHLVYDATNGVWELMNPATVVGAVQTGGTANGVAYLNGSKVLTTGTGFVFDGTNVGIGTSSPNSKMSVAVSSTSTSVLGSYANIPLLLQNTSSTDNNWSVIAVQDASGDFSSYIGTQNTSQASNTAIMAFATNGGSGATERMRITDAGLVGIGTISPVSTSKLTVNGSISVNGSDTNFGAGGQRAFIDFTTNLARIGALSGGVATGTALAFNVANAGGTQFEAARFDAIGNLQVQAGAVMPYAPAPTGIAAATTLTNANIQGQIISATGTTYTITMPLGTTLETLATWATTNIAYDFFVINTASGIITMAVNTGVTSLGSLTVAIGASAHFRIRRTAANTFVLYRLV